MSQAMPLTSTYSSACSTRRLSMGGRPFPCHTTTGSTGSNSAHTSSGTPRAKSLSCMAVVPSGGPPPYHVSFPRAIGFDSKSLAIDASSLGSLFVVLCISVVYRGTAVPVAWKVLPANTKGSWRPPWLGLLQTFHGHLGDDWRVVVLADRGLYAKRLFDGIRKLGWHPMLRINQGGKFRPEGWHRFVPLSSLTPRVGSRFC